MSELLRAANMGSLAAKMQQDDKDLIADVDKLVNITNMLVDTFGSFIIEVYVSPMNLVKQKTINVKHLSFYIIFNGSMAGELSELSQEIRDFLNTIVLDEFEGIDRIDDIVFSTYNNFVKPTILLYTVFNNSTLEDLDDTSYSTLYKLVSECNCALTIPVTYKYAYMKCIYIHAANTYISFTLADKVKKFLKENNLNAVEFTDFKTVVPCIFDILVDFRPLQYDIPYLFIKEKDFSRDRLIRLGLITEEPITDIQ